MNILEGNAVANPPFTSFGRTLSNINNGRPLKIHCCFNEDESTHQQQLAV
ncbi:hypothetical protein Gohar_011917 [Gossypium harknessii]|uniref:Uncharacterized protein n=1 Tax=Gossypium harknessii TaxID=34285 RepID=A0A7J9GVE0_9ROSI|nr:hypothetical protein [Gossypium harknessii]